MSRHIRLFTAGALMPVVGIVRLPLCAVAVGMFQHRDFSPFNIAAGRAGMMLFARFRLGRRFHNFPIAVGMGRGICLCTANRAFVPMAVHIRFPLSAESMVAYRADNRALSKAAEVIASKTASTFTV